VNDHDVTVFREGAKKLTMKCPDCGELMTGTGKLTLDKRTGNWFVEYWCPRSHEYFSIYRPETNPVAEGLAREPDPRTA